MTIIILHYLTVDNSIIFNIFVAGSINMIFMSYQSQIQSINGYHTQEKRYQKIDNPVKCTRSDAWLGEGYYFWEREEFAIKWGEDSKNNYYDIYVATLDISSALDAEYSREGRDFFEKSINKVITLYESRNRRYDLQTIHRVLAEKFWKKLNISGIIYGDLPQSKGFDRLKPLYYIKRVQIVMFGLETINNFKLLK